MENLNESVSPFHDLNNGSSDGASTPTTAPAAFESPPSIIRTQVSPNDAAVPNQELFSAKGAHAKGALVGSLATFLLLAMTGGNNDNNERIRAALGAHQLCSHQCVNNNMGMLQGVPVRDHHVVTHLAILGERNSGVPLLESELKKCYPNVQVSSSLERKGIFFQNDPLSQTYNSVVIQLVLNPYDWLEQMRHNPLYMPEHEGDYNDNGDGSTTTTPMPWNDFLTKEWSSTERENNGDAAFQNIMELRSAKLRNHRATRDWETVKGHFIVQYDNLTQEYEHLLDKIDAATGWLHTCDIIMPSDGNKFPTQSHTHTMSLEFLDHVGANLDWELEEEFGFHKWEEEEAVLRGIDLKGNKGEDHHHHTEELLSFLLLAAGFYPILKFGWEEYKLAKSKRRSHNNRLHFTWNEQLEYRLDFHLSSSEWAKPLLLMGFTFVLIVLGSLLLTMVDDLPVSVSTWLAWTYVADPGTHADAEGLGHKFVSFLITLGGMLVFALLIGIISDVIGEKVDHLKEGKARVLETDHTLILGWSDKTLTIIQEIAFANESEGGGTIVVLAEEPKAELEERLAFALETPENGLQLLGSKVIFRSGNPRMEKSLHQVSASTARSIIALSEEGQHPDEADSRMIRQVLALKSLPDLRSHVVVEMQDIDNHNLVSLVEPHITEVVVTHDVIGRLMIQCARTPGLANVIEELIGFQGSEFYFDEWPELVGKSFFDVTCRFDDAIPAGVKTVEGKIIVNPDNDYILKKGDKLLCLAEDNDSYSVNDGSFQIKDRKEFSEIMPPVHKEKLLFCGWRRDMADMITQLDEYVHEGSELWLFNAVPTKDRQELFLDKGNKEELITKNLTIKHVVGNPIVRRDLLMLQASDEAGNLTGEVAYLDDFDSLLILADVENGTDMQSSDSRSLSSVLNIQDIQQKLHAQHVKEGKATKTPCSPISEILDTRTRSLLLVANCTSYVMSNQIISSFIAQVAEDRDLNSVLSYLLCAEGSEIYLRKASRYMELDKGADYEESFWNIAVRARCMGQLALGFQRKDDGFKVILNPPNKADKLKWTHDDDIIVMALE